MPQFSNSLFQTDENKASVLSVSSLNKLARSLLETNFPLVAVEGEISNLIVPSSGHMYLTLKDKRAQIRCAMFKNRNQLLRFRPKDGSQVILRGRLSIYEGRGDYQLIVDSMEEAGDGALRRAFEELKAKLQAEGLFNAELKQEVGDQFRHIGIITSRTGAAIRDIVSVFGRRYPAIKLTLLPVAVQGAESVNEIVRAIRLANQLQDKLALEALIIGRGGGSLEDLQAFNEEAVARAIHASELPVVSAVGHETDFTISDFVADLRAPTPSAAAELLSPDISEALSNLDGVRSALAQTMSARLTTEHKNLQWIHRHLKRPDRRLQDYAQTLDRLDYQLRRRIHSSIANARSELRQRQRAMLAISPGSQLRNSSQQLRSILSRLNQQAEIALHRRKSHVAELARSLSAVSPLQVLARGYSITANDSGQILRSVSDTRPGEKLVSTLADGKITSTIDRIDSKH